MSRRAFVVPSFAMLAMMCLSCSREQARPAAAVETPLPSILLVTLDTTRADSLGFESPDVETPALDALAARGTRFSQAWATVPMTLPSHSSMMTGLYASEHGIRENSRALDEDRPLLAEYLRDAGYATAAFVSGYPLKRQFGLARGFDHYDDDMGRGNAERTAGPTTDRAVAYLESRPPGRVFVWVHYFDPHDPYAPPEPFASRYPDSPYLGEIAYMDHELGRLVEAFEGRGNDGGSRVLVVGDHGEGLGDHGELLHGNLLYRGVMRVPMVAAGSGIPSTRVETAVSTRRVFDTIRGWAGLPSSFDLLEPEPEVVMGEALKPYLQYGWQPQVMAVWGTTKVIQSGDTEVFDLLTDPQESVDLGGGAEIDPVIVEAIRNYELVPAADGKTTEGTLDQESREQLAALGYVGWESPAPVRENAPNPRDMTHLFDDLNEGSELFVREEYEASIGVFERVVAEDAENLMVTVRLAVAYSMLGNRERALGALRSGRTDTPRFDRSSALSRDALFPFSTVGPRGTALRKGARRDAAALARPRGSGPYSRGRTAVRRRHSASRTDHRSQGRARGGLGAIG